MTRTPTMTRTRTSTFPPMILTSPYATIVALLNTALISARPVENCSVFVTLHMRNVASGNADMNTVYSPRWRGYPISS